MAKGFDTATPLTGAIAASFKADGYEFAVRYIDSNASSWKLMTKNEAEIISNAGLQIISVFERTGNQANITPAQGKVDGTAALQAAIQLSQPERSTIYYAVDYDAQPSDMDNIEGYILAASAATPTYSTGIYGSAAVIEEMQKRGACSHFWQTYAWSRHKAAGIQLYQYQNDIMIHGISVDLNDSYGGEGWWNAAPLIEKSDSDKLTAICAEFYKLGVTLLTLHDGSVVKVDQAEFHRLANVVRAAAGQPVQ